ncbi:hypothetical protein [Trichormus sp. NMC-1]|nr:hypothetical protein [Trichormus sp. NMC-1]
MVIGFWILDFGFWVRIQESEGAYCNTPVQESGDASQTFGSECL